MTEIKISWARCPFCGVDVPLLGMPSAAALRFSRHRMATTARCAGSLRDARAAVCARIREDLEIMKDYEQNPTEMVAGARAQLAAIEESMAKERS